MISPEVVEFLRHNYFLIVYGISWIVSVFYYKKYFDTVLKYFPILIAYTFFNELLGYIVGTSEDFALFNKLSSANDLIYNIYALVFFPYFYFIYWTLIKSERLRTFLKPLFILTGLAFIVNCFFVNPLIKILFYAIALASVVLVICISIYGLDKKLNWSWSLEKYNLMTWVSIGLFIFHLIFPIVFLIIFLDSEIWQKYHLGYVHKGLIVLMYSLFCLGFIKSRRRAFR